MAIVRNKEVIHSGHFMISDLERNTIGDEYVEYEDQEALNLVVWSKRRRKEEANVTTTGVNHLSSRHQVMKSSETMNGVDMSCDQNQSKIQVNKSQTSVSSSLEHTTQHDIVCCGGDRVVDNEDDENTDDLNAEDWKNLWRHKRHKTYKRLAPSSTLSMLDDDNMSQGPIYTVYSGPCMSGYQGCSEKQSVMETGDGENRTITTIDEAMSSQSTRKHSHVCPQKGDDELKNERNKNMNAKTFDGNVNIGITLNSLLNLMRLTYRQKFSCPKWNRFRGLGLPCKHKIRLNNVTWRCWYLQFIKGCREENLMCTFAHPSITDDHNRTEAGTVLEGKYWKRHVVNVSQEYINWRRYYKISHYKKAGMTTTTTLVNLSTNECGHIHSHLVHRSESRYLRDLHTFDDSIDEGKCLFNDADDCLCGFEASRQLLEIPNEQFIYSSNENYDTPTTTSEDKSSNSSSNTTMNTTRTIVNSQSQVGTVRKLNFKKPGQPEPTDFEMVPVTVVPMIHESNVNQSLKYISFKAAEKVSTANITEARCFEDHENDHSIKIKSEFCLQDDPRAIARQYCDVDQTETAENNDYTQQRKSINVIPTDGYKGNISPRTTLNEVAPGEVNSHNSDFVVSDKSLRQFTTNIDDPSNLKYENKQQSIRRQPIEFHKINTTTPLLKSQDNTVMRRKTLTPSNDSFESLRQLLPVIRNCRTSKAALLFKAGDYIKSLKEERRIICDTSCRMKQQKYELEQSITRLQNELDIISNSKRLANEDEMSGNKTFDEKEIALNRRQFEQTMNSYIYSKMQKNHKYWIFATLFYKRLMETFNEVIGLPNSMITLENSVMTWRTNHLKLTQLRTSSVQGLKDVAIKTDALNNLNYLLRNAR